MEKLLSDRSVELRYARQSEGGKYKNYTCERSIQGLALIARASRVDKTKKEDIILDPIFPVQNLLEQQNDTTVDTIEDEPNQSNTDMVDGWEQPNSKGNGGAEALQETNTILDLKTPLKKQPTITVAFPKNIPRIKDIKRKQRK